METGLGQGLKAGHLFLPEVPLEKCPLTLKMRLPYDPACNQTKVQLFLTKCNSFLTQIVLFTKYFTEASVTQSWETNTFCLLHPSPPPSQVSFHICIIDNFALNGNHSFYTNFQFVI